MVITLPPIFGFPNSGFLLDIDGYVKFTLGNSEKLLVENFKWVPGLHVTMTRIYIEKLTVCHFFGDTLHDVQLF
jgi:hypothetical protein